MNIVGKQCSLKVVLGQALEGAGWGLSPLAGYSDLTLHQNLKCLMMSACMVSTFSDQSIPLSSYTYTVKHRALHITTLLNHAHTN